MLKFSIKINDDEHSLSKENGIPFDKLAELLKSLFEAIDPHTGAKCTLGRIRGKSYDLDFFTLDEKFHSNFVIVHKNIEQHSEIDLRDKEKRYADTLKVILGSKYYLQAFDNKNIEVAKLRELTFKKEIDHYFATKNVYGRILEIGNKDFKTKPHVFISDNPYKVYLTIEQDFQLKQYYKTHDLSFRLKQKISLKDKHIISAELIDFKVKSEGKFIDNIKNVDIKELNILKDINSSDDILKKLYGYS